MAGAFDGHFGMMQRAQHSASCATTLTNINQVVAVMDEQHARMPVQELSSSYVYIDVNPPMAEPARRTERFTPASLPTPLRP